MRLLDLLARQTPPTPWAEGDNIPWHDPAFSARMLAEHLSQDHDAASRRAATIARQIAWLGRAVLPAPPSAILDLGCGPGLYTNGLARLGHACVGIDYSPASIAFARAAAEAEGLPCRFLHADLRAADYGTGFGAALLIFGELNVFSRADAGSILAKVAAALAPGGVLILEPHTFDAVRRAGTAPPAWYTTARGLFSPTPHLVLREHFWDAASRAATIRYFVVDLADGGVTRHAQSLQAYTDDEYRDLLRACGFGTITFSPSLTGDPDPAQADFCAIVARR